MREYGLIALVFVVSTITVCSAVVASYYFRFLARPVSFWLAVRCGSRFTLSLSLGLSLGLSLSLGHSLSLSVTLSIPFSTRSFYALDIC